jgi:hypothetical protein
MGGIKNSIAKQPKAIKIVSNDAENLISDES